MRQPIASPGNGFMTTEEKQDSVWTSRAQACALIAFIVPMLQAAAKIIGYSVVHFPPPTSVLRFTAIGAGGLFVLCWRTYRLRRWAGIALSILLCSTIYFAASACLRAIHRHLPLAPVWHWLPATFVNSLLGVALGVAIYRGWQQLRNGW